MRKYGKFTILGVALTIAALTTSCGTKKAITNDGADIRKTTTTAADNSHGKNAKSERAMETAKMDFLRKVTDNAAYARNIVSKIKFTMNTGSKDITVAGSLHMRKDEVISSLHSASWRPEDWNSQKTTYCSWTEYTRNT